MTRFHVNPETGNIGQCYARVSCPFGDFEFHHYATEAQARTAYEESMRDKTFKVELPDQSDPAVKVMISTVHGSHLYGLANQNSDRDYYQVITNQDNKLFKSLQSIDGDDDVLKVSLTEFFLRINDSVPQALEALYSPLQTGPLRHLGNSYYINTPTFANVYRRTLMNFARLGLQDERALGLLPSFTYESGKRHIKESSATTLPTRVSRNGMLKYRRHALRLMLNRETGLKFGRFNPMLTTSEIDFVKTNAELSPMKFATLISSRAYL